MPMNKVKITVLKTTLDRELGRGIRSGRIHRLSHAERGADFLCRLRQAGGLLRRGVESHISICFRTCARRGNGRFLLRRLDPHSGRRDLQLQRRAASCYFQAGGYRPKIGAGLCAGPVNVSQKRSSAIFGLYFYKAYAIITRSK